MEEYTGIFFKYRELNPYNEFNTKQVDALPNNSNLYFNNKITDWLNKKYLYIDSMMIDDKLTAIKILKTLIEPIEQTQEFTDSKIIHKTEFGTPGLI